MTFDRLNRRTHLYFGIVLAPWFFMFGASTLVFNHGEFFRDLHDKNEPAWTLLYERDYQPPPYAGPGEAWIAGGKILEDLGLPGNYRAWVTQEGVFQIIRIKFLSRMRIRYYPDRRRLAVEQSVFRWDNFLTGMHVRGGWEGSRFWDNFWGLTVDLVALATLMWVFSGLYIWWKLTRFRFWGGVCLAAGGLSFLGFMLRL